MNLTNEQWLSDGNCSICRRANYCKKDCKAYKNRKFGIIKQAYQDVLEKQYPEMAQIMKEMQIYKD